MIVPLALALSVAAGQIPLATETELPSGQKVSLAADQLVYEPAKETLIAKGHTVLQSEGVTLRADEIVYDQSVQKAWARGNVMFVSGLLVAVADEVSVDVRTLEANVKGGLFLRKKNVTEEQLLAARTPYELKKTGETELTITGNHIQRVGKNEFRVDELSFTPCDCDPTEPSWRVEAHRADVELGERALLTWPVIYVYQVPVFAVPWLYVPLSERRTGFLVPKPNISPLTGFSLETPFFLTLGESYDLTFTPGWYFGANPDAPYGIKGGRLHTEFRYVPSDDTHGHATVGLLYDFLDRRDPRFPDRKLKGVERGVRMEASWQHLQELGHGWRDRVDMGFVSDGYYFRDVTTDVLARQSGYLRSTGTLNHHGEDDYFGIEAVVRQPVHTDSQPYGFDYFHLNRTVLPGGLPGPVIDPPRTFQRLPAITYAVPERPIAGPVWGGFRAEYVRLAPLDGSFGDEGYDGVFLVGPDDPFQGDRIFEPGERQARDRIDLRPQLSLPFASKWARLTPYVGFRESLYLSEVTGDFAHRGYPIAGINLGTTLLREFGKGEGALRHTLIPEVEMRYVPFVLGGVPGAAYDEVDSAIRGERLWQLVAQVRQIFGVRQGASYRELLRLDLGQGFDLLSGRAADTFARAEVRGGPLTLSLIARYDIPAQRVSQVSGQLNWDAGHGTNVHLSYDNLLLVGSDPLRAGIDELVGEPLSLLTPEQNVRAEQLVGGFRTVLPFGLGLRYDAVVQPAAEFALAQQVVGVSYGPGCDCWRLEVYANVQPDRAEKPRLKGLLGPFNAPTFGASLTISQFGSFGSGG